MKGWDGAQHMCIFSGVVGGSRGQGPRDANCQHMKDMIVNVGLRVVSGRSDEDCYMNEAVLLPLLARMKLQKCLGIPDKQQLQLQLQMVHIKSMKIENINEEIVSKIKIDEETLANCYLAAASLQIGLFAGSKNACAFFPIRTRTWSN